MRYLTKHISFVILLVALIFPLAVWANNTGFVWKGTVSSFPDGGTVGTWVIGGRSFQANASTLIEQDHGSPSVVGACVEVHYYQNVNVNVATKISTTELSQCTSTTTPTTTTTPDDQTPTVTVTPTEELTPTTTVTPDDQTPTATITDEEQTPTVTTTPTPGEDDNHNGDDSHGKVLKFYGLIQDFPSNFLGVWNIGGKNFTSVATTTLVQEAGTPFATGVCVGVEYKVLSGVNVAKKISTEQLYRCSRGTESNAVYGTIASLPTGLYGTWTIQTRVPTTTTVEVTSTTHLKQEHGQFAVGSCVKVIYHVQDGVAYADRIEGEEARFCTQQPDNGHHDNPHHVRPLPGDGKVYATIDAFPASLLGQWTIGGLVYSSTNQTRFKQEHGSFDVGVCVRAKYDPTDGVNTLFKVETVNSRKCLDKDSAGHHILKSYGVVETLPTSSTLVGDWQISGISYQTISTTLFKQEHGFFSVGSYVEVKYRLDGDTRIALSIETHVSCGGGRGNVFGHYERHETNSAGDDVWVIDGVRYQSDPVLEVNVDDTSASSTTASVGLSANTPATGELVSVNYFEGTDGTRYATTISSAQQIFIPLVIQ